MATRNQQNEFWIYLSVCWWLGSFSAWMLAWFIPGQGATNESSLTMAGVLVIAVSACLRLPVLTSIPVTTTSNDHFTWLLNTSAMLNWLGYLGLHAATPTAILPTAVIGIVIECWLWNQVLRTDCLVWYRQWSLTVAGWLLPEGAQPQLSGNTSTNETRQTNEQQGATASTDWPPLAEPDSETIELNGSEGVLQITTSEPALRESKIERTQQDGIDATGVRFIAGEVVVHWAEQQRTQQITLGFVPALPGKPQVEMELDCDQATAQLVNCSSAGMRIQLKRNSTASHSCSLSWYVRSSTEDPLTITNAQLPLA
jgi:hypothetical protein